MYYAAVDVRRHESTSPTRHTTAPSPSEPVERDRQRRQLRAGVPGRRPSGSAPASRGRSILQCADADVDPLHLRDRRPDPSTARPSSISDDFGSSLVYTPAGGLHRQPTGSRSRAMRWRGADPGRVRVRRDRRITARCAGLALHTPRRRAALDLRSTCSRPRRPGRERAARSSRVLPRTGRSAGCRPGRRPRSTSPTSRRRATPARTRSPSRASDGRLTGTVAPRVHVADTPYCDVLRRRSRSSRGRAPSGRRCAAPSRTTRGRADVQGRHAAPAKGTRERVPARSSRTPRARPAGLTRSRSPPPARPANVGRDAGDRRSPVGARRAPPRSCTVAQDAACSTSPLNCADPAAATRSSRSSRRPPALQGHARRHRPVGAHASASRRRPAFTGDDVVHLSRRREPSPRLCASSSRARTRRRSHRSRAPARGVPAWRGR